MALVGENLLSCALTEIFKKMGSVVTDGISGAWKLEADLEKLRESIGRIREAQVTADDKKFWELQEVIYCADNVLDEFHYKTLRHEAENQLKHKLRDFVSLNNPVLYRIGMATTVKKLYKKFPELEDGVTPAPAAAANTGVDQSSLKERMTDSVLENTPFGRTDEVNEIIDMLQTSPSDPPPLTVVSIVGFGGLGKTFLAKLVKNKVQGMKLFDEFMWVCVSESFDRGKILREMLQKLDEHGGMQSNNDATIDHLQKKLTGKRSFLVLDDVWSEEHEEWDNLKTRLIHICGQKGNFAIVVTTRKERVAQTMESKHIMKLNQLTEEECWSIIKEKVAGDEGESVISNDMKIIGKDIARKCGGVPLAAKVLGGVLRSPMNIDEWLSIQNSDLWNEGNKEKRILGVLKLSYYRLLPPQKLCFSYCSLFRKDFVFYKEKLIQLWMAEGFLETSEGRSKKLMEDVGEEYFHSFLADSFFQDPQVDFYGNIVGCKMHDLLHDLASDISNSQRLCGSNCIQTSDGSRMTFLCYQVSEVQKILASSNDKTRNSRALFCRVDVSQMLSNFRRLRSLDMSSARLKDLPAAMRKLKHLRYLDISYNEHIQVLPEFITKLYNLQTLRVFYFTSLQRLPGKIPSLVSLRHICFDDKRLMPSKVGDLIDLQTLSIFVVGQDGQMIDELGKLKQLRGDLLVCGLENVRNKGEAERAKLKEKKLSKLGLEWTEVVENEGEDFHSSRECNHGEVMEGIGAPTNTQELTVEWYMGKQFPGWMSDLKKLVMLKLKNCRRCETMPTLGHLPNLKNLQVQRMDSLKVIGNEFYGESNNADALFPLLEEFSINKMKSLVEWVAPTGTEIFPKLRRLDLICCPNLTSFPWSQSTSSATRMRLRSSYGNGVFSAGISCLRDFKSLQGLCIFDCPKLTFHHIGLTSIQSFIFCEGENFPYFDDLLECSNKLGKSWKCMSMRGVVEIIREFPKSLEALEISGLGNRLSPEAFHGLSCLTRLAIKDCDSLESISSLSSLTSLEHLEINNCSRLELIPSPTSLKHLKIKCCESLESIPSLSSLTSLEHLEIYFCSGLELIPSPTSLKHLEIGHCESLKSISSLSSLASLEHLKIIYCESLKSILSLSSLASLEHLKICCCQRLESIPSISSSSSLKHLELSGFDHLGPILTLPSHTSLKHLEIYNCKSLESISSLSSLASLEHLEIGWCLRLESIPSISSSSSLKHLEICWCSRLKLIPSPTSLKHLRIYDCVSLKSISSLSSLASLEHLEIGRCPRLESIPSISSSSTCLEKLIISQCHNLRSLSGEIKLCTSLKELTVAYCRGMVSIDDDVMGYLTQLEKLVWGGFSEELDQLPGLDSIHLLTSLQELEIIGWNKLTSLPSQIQRLTSITLLEIKGFDALESLPDWICKLSSLQNLRIWDCKSLKNLTTGVQCLSGLTELKIRWCPLLAERCIKDTGPEWSNISHIPLIKIENEVIQDVRCGRTAEISC